jgi:hypothetical protein
MIAILTCDQQLEVLVFYNFIQQFCKYNYDKFLIQYDNIYSVMVLGVRWVLKKKKLLFTGERLIFDVTFSSLITDSDILIIRYNGFASRTRVLLRRSKCFKELLCAT